MVPPSLLLQVRLPSIRPGPKRRSVSPEVQVGRAYHYNVRLLDERAVE